MVDLEVWWDVDGESGKRMDRAIRRGHASTYRRAPERLVPACAGGKARWIERETTKGLIRELLDTLKLSSRAEHLDRRRGGPAGRRA